MGVRTEHRRLTSLEYSNVRNRHLMRTYKVRHIRESTKRSRVQSRIEIREQLVTGVEPRLVIQIEIVIEAPPSPNWVSPQGVVAWVGA